MKNAKPKKSVLDQKPLSKKKKSLKMTSLPKKAVVKPPIKKLITSELPENHERTEWRKEKREYWSTRFRKILAEIALRPKVKKSSFF